MKRMGEIYKVTNTVTGEIYIGATTKSIEERRIDHIQKANNDLGSYFQQAIGTYGSEAFSWEQIDTAENSNELAAKETYYILQYNSKESGYNEDRGGGFKKTIYQYNLEGQFMQSFENLSSAASALTITKKRISKICLGKNNLLDNCYLSYIYTEPFVPEIDLRKKSVLQYDLEDNLLDVHISASEASRQTGISKTCITRCCRGERERSGGFHWKYS